MAYSVHFQGTTFSRRATDARHQHAYDTLIFKKLVSQLFYLSHTNECCIFAIAMRRLLELTNESFQSREELTGAPLLAVGSIDRILPVRMRGFTAIAGTIITKLTLIQQVNLTSLTHRIFNLRKLFYYTMPQANARRLRY